MADTDKDKVWISALVEKDLAQQFDALVKELDTDRSKLLRQIVREKLEEAERVRIVARKVKPLIRETVRK